MMPPSRGRSPTKKPRGDRDGVRRDAYGQPSLPPPAVRIIDPYRRRSSADGYRGGYDDRGPPPRRGPSPPQRRPSPGGYGRERGYGGGGYGAPPARDDMRGGGYPAPPAAPCHGDG